MKPTLDPLPESFVSRLAKIVGQVDLDSCLHSFQQVRPTAFRRNSLAGSRDEVIDGLKESGIVCQAVDWLDDAWTVSPEMRSRLTRSTFIEQGHIYVQRLSSMLAPMILAPQPGESVLDLAAAPGGKTLQMAAMMQNQGQLSAVEPVKARYYRLTSNVKKYGASMVRCYPTDGRGVGRKVGERFDRVLLDAPCSAEARFHQLDPSSWKYWSLRKVKQMAHKQVALLRSAVDALRPGGTLVYCTCCFSPEENEAVVDQVIKQHASALQVVPIEMPVDHIQPGLTRWENLSFDESLAASVRLLPNQLMDGFYLCKLHKLQSTAPANASHRPSKNRRSRSPRDKRQR